MTTTYIDNLSRRSIISATLRGLAWLCRLWIETLATSGSTTVQCLATTGTSSTGLIVSVDSVHAVTSRRGMVITDEIFGVHTTNPPPIITPTCCNASAAIVQPSRVDMRSVLDLLEQDNEPGRPYVDFR